MKYAVISAQGKQYRVAEGDELIIDRLTAEEGNDYVFSDVLLVVDEAKRSIGAPLVKGAKVTAKVVSHLRGNKIRVATFKSKSRYRRVIGHRQDQTKLSILKIQ